MSKTGILYRPQRATEGESLTLRTTHEVKVLMRVDVYNLNETQNYKLLKILVSMPICLVPFEKSRRSANILWLVKRRPQPASRSLVGFMAVRAVTLNTVKEMMITPPDEQWPLDATDLSQRILCYTK